MDAHPWSHAVLAPVSKCYPPVWDRLLTRYSPVRHSNMLPFRPKPSVHHIPVRLACVKHAASVRPEPGSNSDVQSFPFSPVSLPARQSPPFPRKLRCFTHRILTLPIRFAAPASGPSSQLRRSLLSRLSVSFSRFAFAPISGPSFVQRKCYYTKSRCVCQAFFSVQPLFKLWKMPLLTTICGVFPAMIYIFPNLKIVKKRIF